MEIEEKYIQWARDKHPALFNSLTNSDIQTFAIEFANEIISKEGGRLDPSSLKNRDQKNIGHNLINDEMLINNICASYRHDFGLMPKIEQDRLRFQCKEWMRALLNNI